MVLTALILLVLLQCVPRNLDKNAFFAQPDLSHSVLAFLVNPVTSV